MPGSHEQAKDDKQTSPNPWPDQTPSGGLDVYPNVQTHRIMLWQLTALSWQVSLHPLPLSRPVPGSVPAKVSLLTP